MEENGWECGQDDEELFEFAMHETQYRDYKSGLAKEMFEKKIWTKKWRHNKTKPTKSKSAVTEKKAKNPKEVHNNKKNKVEYPNRDDGLPSLFNEQQENWNHSPCF